MSFQGNYEEFPNVLDIGSASTNNRVDTIFDALMKELKKTVEDFDKNACGFSAIRRLQPGPGTRAERKL